MPPHFRSEVRDGEVSSTILGLVLRHLIFLSVSEIQIGVLGHLSHHVFSIQLFVIISTIKKHIVLVRRNVR